MRMSVVLAVTLLAPMPSAAQAPATTSAPRVSFALPNSEVRSLKSQITNRTHYFHVVLPDDYATNGKRYPALYVLDGDARTVLTSQIARSMANERHIPQHILVGLGYGEDIPAWQKSRTRDYTPTSATAGESGAAAEYLNFLINEAVPFIEGMYRTEPGDRSLYGFSLGGLFAMYAMFERGDTFHRFIAVSPSLWWDDRVLLRTEERSAAKKARLTQTLYMSIGGRESAPMLDSFRPMAEYLRMHEPSLKLTVTEIEGETHSSGVAPALIRGLRTVFADAMQRPE